VDLGSTVSPLILHPKSFRKARDFGPIAPKVSMAIDTNNVFSSSAVMDRKEVIYSVARDLAMREPRGKAAEEVVLCFVDNTDVFVSLPMGSDKSL